MNKKKPNILPLQDPFGNTLIITEMVIDEWDEHPYLMISDLRNNIEIYGEDTLNALANAIEVTLLKWEENLAKRKRGEHE